MPSKGFKITVLKMLRELQENTGKQFNKMRGKIQEQNEKFDTEIENIKNQPNRNFGAKGYSD